MRKLWMSPFIRGMEAWYGSNGSRVTDQKCLQEVASIRQFFGSIFIPLTIFGNIFLTFWRHYGIWTVFGYFIDIFGHILENRRTKIGHQYHNAMTTVVTP